MNKLLFNYYWLASSISAKLFWLIVPVFFIHPGLSIPFLVSVVVLGWSAIMIAAFFKCPSCNKRALVHSGSVVKQLQTNRGKLQVWLLPNEFVCKFFYCCKCGQKIQSTS